MKKKMKTAALVMALCLIVLSIVGCGSESDQNSGSARDASFDFSAYPADFSAWTMAEMKSYLKECGITANEDFLGMDMTEGDLGVIGAEAGYLYMDTDGGTVSDMIIYFDVSKEDGKAMIDTTVEHKAIVIDGDVENGMAMDAVVGGFCFSYTMGTDEDHISAFAQALKALETQYAIKADHINE